MAKDWTPNQGISSCVMPFEVHGLILRGQGHVGRFMRHIDHPFRQERSGTPLVIFDRHRRRRIVVVLENSEEYHMPSGGFVRELRRGLPPLHYPLEISGEGLRTEQPRVGFNHPQGGRFAGGNLIVRVRPTCTRKHRLTVTDREGTVYLANVRVPLGPVRSTIHCFPTNRDTHEQLYFVATFTAPRPAMLPNQAMFTFIDGNAHAIHQLARQAGERTLQEVEPIVDGLRVELTPIPFPRR